MIRRSILTILFAACMAATLRANYFPSLVESEECRQWVDSVFASLSPRERVAQLFVPFVDPAKGEQSRALIKKYVGDNHVGGLIFRKGTVGEYARMINYAQSLAEVPVMMTFDGEWGLAMRIPETSRFPYNMALGAVTDYKLLEEYGAEVARQCRELGIHVDFAPVADVNLNPDNPVIGRRSFGENPERVAKAVVAFSRGMESEGVISCAKHFPGHGDTSTDSHKTLPVVDHSREFLSENDLLPFARYFDSGLSGVMVGHLSVPALDETMTPASMSAAITTDLLKNEMGFKGLVFTDALEMKGASRQENNCVTAIRAGADMLLGSGAPVSDITAVEQAVSDGRIDQAEIDSRCRKILAYKWALGLRGKQPAIDLNGLTKRLNTPSSRDLIERLTIASISIPRDRCDLLPLSAGHSIAFVNLGANVKNEFTDVASRHADIARYADSSAPLSDAAIEAIAAHEVVIVGVYNDNAQTLSNLKRLAKRCSVVPVMFMTPYKAMKFKDELADADAFMIAYDANPIAYRAAADAIFGGNNVTGRLNVTMPGIAQEGDAVTFLSNRLSFSNPSTTSVAPWLCDSIDAIMKPALAAGAFPGAQVMIVKDGKVIVDKCYGRTANSPEASPVDASTLFDVASVSKAVGTLPGIMLARERGLIDLDAPLSRYIPLLAGTPKADLTPRQLLFHQSGLPASLDMYKLMMDPDSYSGPLVRGRAVAPNTIKIARNAYGHSGARLRRDIVAKAEPATPASRIGNGIWALDCAYDTIMGRIYDIPLKAPSFRYSCLNFCLLMDIEQRVTHMPHQQWVAENIFEPIGAFSACYRPLEKFPAERIAVTEKDNYLRRQQLRGYVHDELAAFSGGVQGNAGLFASATDIAKYSQMLLNGGAYGGARVLSPAVVAEFTRTVSPTCHRGLGFDRPNLENPDKSSTVEEAPASTYGHIGFTGTCFWVDPDNRLIYVFLSNRVCPSRDNSAWFKQKARSRVQSVIYKAL
ncbi:MAG: serine hydrolase [Muribaculaceae bacterium]|nr:serine hydrolase [Muribaculaceae bacterium]